MSGQPRPGGPTPPGARFAGSAGPHPGAGVDARIAAFRALRWVHEAGAWSSQAVDRALRDTDLDARDRSFAASLAYETLRWQATLDWALACASSRPLDQVEPPVLDVLRLGAWQVLYGRQPDRAAVGTAVETAKAEIGPRVAGFVNGVLRGLARRRDELPWPAEDTDAGLGLALGYPAWVVAEARARFGERARAELEAGNANPGVTLRAVDPVGGAQALHGPRAAAALAAELADAGLETRPGAHAPEAVRAPGADPGRLDAVREGRAVVQDEASMLVARAVGGAPGRVLDACAGPGGKATHLAQLGWQVFAADIHPSRARLVRDLAARTGLDESCHVLVADASRPPFPGGAFDAVLVDAPCTGLGTVRRRPELRWVLEPADVDRLAQLQLRILVAVADLVRPGGRLVYSVCTWTRAETEDVVRRLLAITGNMLRAGERGELGRQMSPVTDDVDAMYLCPLVRAGQPSG